MGNKTSNKFSLEERDLAVRLVPGSQYVSIRCTERLAEAGIGSRRVAMAKVTKRPRLNHQRLVQGRGNLPQIEIANQIGGGTGPTRMGALVEPPRIPRTNRLYPSVRS